METVDPEEVHSKPPLLLALFRSARTSSIGSVSMSVTLIAHKLIYTVYPNTKSSTNFGFIALQHNSTAEP